MLPYLRFWLHKRWSKDFSILTVLRPYLLRINKLMDWQDAFKVSVCAPNVEALNSFAL